MKIRTAQTKYADWTPCFAWAPVLIGGHWHWLTAVEKKVDRQAKYGLSYLYRIPDDPETVARVAIPSGVVPPPPRPRTAPAHFQDRVMKWARECFGDEIVYDRRERNHRFVEEALELAQALDCTADEAHQLVDYVFGRPVGEPYQEVGGVVVTLAALCGAAGLTMSEAAEYELARVWKKIDQIRAKQATKPKHSPLPGRTVTQPAKTGLSRSAVDAEAMATALPDPRPARTRLEAQLIHDRDRLIAALRLLVDPRPILSPEEFRVATRQAKSLLTELEMRAAE